MHQSLFPFSVANDANSGQWTQESSVASVMGARVFLGTVFFDRKSAVEVFRGSDRSTALLYLEGFNSKS